VGACVERKGGSAIPRRVFHVNALGTAHGKTRAAWQGSGSQPKFDQSRFALALPKC